MAIRNSSKQLSSGCLTLFGLPFLAAGLFLSWLYFSGYAKWWSARNWQETPCRIESADLKVSHGDDSNTYKALATYRYEYEGRTYHGDRVSLGSGSDNVGGFQHAAHRELSRFAGKDSAPFRCFVNPAKPDEAVLYRTLRWQMQAFMAIFALTFPAVGAGVVAGGLLGMRLLKREAALRERNPGEPWKWKTAWADSTIPESSTAWSRALHLYTFWSGLVIVPLIASTAMSGAFQQPGPAWLLLIFVALWAVPVSLSVRRLRQRLAIGTTRFEPKEIPAWPGGSLHGSILLEKPLPPRGAAEVSLTCEKSVTRGTGDGRTTTTEKIWSHHDSVPQDLITRDLSGFRLPVSFALPADAPESDSGSDPETKHAWKLELKVPGTAIRSVFEVPVFRTAKSPLPENVPSAVPSILDEAAADLPALLAARRISAEFDGAGLPVSIVCPPARNLQIILFLVVFDLIWSAAAVFLIKQHAPLVFRIVWPVSAAGIWLIVLWNLLHKRSVSISPTGLVVRNQLGPVIWTQAFEKAHITGFSHDTNMASGNTVFYRVRLQSVLGKNKTLCDGITESTTAAALVKRLEAWKKSGV
jgi:hypothetical protein